MDHAWIGAFAAVICYILVFGKKVGHLKVLDSCSISFFLISGVLMLFWHPIWFIKHLDYLANGFLAMVVLYTVLNKKPFTLEYAKETTPKESWSSPYFYRVNVILSLVWFFYFALSLPFIYLSDTVSPWFRVGQGLLAVLAVVITELFPRWYTKRL